MKKIISIEKSIYRFIQREDLTDEEKQVFERTLNFWKIYDALFGTNHAIIMKTLYNPNTIDHSNTYKVLKFNISQSTMIRYRKIYIQSLYVVNEHMHLSFD